MSTQAQTSIEISATDARAIAHDAWLFGMDAVYPVGTVDADGKPFNGANKYAPIQEV